jgi:hypothetical protein
MVLKQILVHRLELQYKVYNCLSVDFDIFHIPIQVRYAELFSYDSFQKCVFKAYGTLYLNPEVEKHTHRDHRKYAWLHEIHRLMAHPVWLMRTASGSADFEEPVDLANVSTDYLGYSRLEEQRRAQAGSELSH